jgi:hypothetical protein
MFSKRLTALAAVAASLVWASTASAVTVSIGLQQTGVNGGAITIPGTEVQLADFASFAGSYGSFNLNATSGIVGNGSFNTNSNNQASAAGTLNVYITAQGITDPTGILAALSSFTENILNTTITSVTEQTFLDPNNNLWGTTFLLASHVFSGSGLQTASSLNFGDVGDGPYSITALYTIVATGAGGANSTINISAETPLPGTLPLIAGGLGALWMVGRKRKARKSPAVA